MENQTRVVSWLSLWLNQVQILIHRKYSFKMKYSNSLVKMEISCCCRKITGWLVICWLIERCRWGICRVIPVKAIVFKMKMTIIIKRRKDREEEERQNWEVRIWWLWESNRRTKINMAKGEENNFAMDTIIINYFQNLTKLHQIKYKLNE